MLPDASTEMGLQTTGHSAMWFFHYSKGGWCLNYSKGLKANGHSVAWGGYFHYNKGLRDGLIIEIFWWLVKDAEKKMLAECPQRRSDTSRRSGYKVCY
ncbi:hypothetical protein PF005_g25057 [Phytophthora fragariae]|uniref:Uncharacterized protein n=2 Tax=Phytophthora fragariae TaxID=53985 RepID=A0A6A3W583_9STRA|nr:hypothetical protein PF005_g25057 [Phytophthora fragariae]KAE9181585.1 hypothetical protein PF004_g24500 [Phytophthora fragariae]